MSLRCAMDARKMETITDPGILAGRKLTCPSPGDEIVISGMSGSLPNCENLSDFYNNLVNKVEMIDERPLRWEHTHPEIPKMLGKICNLDKFDNGFFGVHCGHAHEFDPLVRVTIEKVYETIIDAGYSIEEFEGSKTSVYIGTCTNESGSSWASLERMSSNFNFLGSVKSVITSQVSYFFKLQGPAVVCDTACSSSLYALDAAYKALRDGVCDYALVGGVNLCLLPMTTLQFARLGVLSPGYGCKSFDEAADGYTRSEAIVCLLLQKAKTAKRIYGELVHTKTNSDGYKELGITYPSGDSQMTLIREVFLEANIHPNDISMVEAHGTGTRVGDPEELRAISEVICRYRDKPLPIGAVKSGIGHTEASAGICSIIKTLLGMEAEIMLPNIRYSQPREGVTALKDGSLKVITDSTAWPDEKMVVSINSFGFGGANANVLLRRYNNPRQNVPDDGVPRLVCASGRTEEAVEVVLDNVRKEGYNVELIRLIHDVFRYNTGSHYYKGFSVITKNGEVYRETYNPQTYTEEFVCLFGDTFANAAEVLRDLTKLKGMDNILCRLDNVLENNNKHSPLDRKEIYDSIIATVKIHIIIITVLKQIQLEPHKIFSYSIGELASAYFFGSTTLEETILLAHYVALAKAASNTFALVEQLNKVITKASERDARWIAVHETNGGTVNSKFSSAQYFAEAVFKKPSSYVRTNVRKAIALNVGYLENVDLKFGNVVNLCFESRNAVEELLIGIGRLYNSGKSFAVANIYPEIKFPVNRGTPMLSPFIRWNHTKSWFVMTFKSQVIPCGNFSTATIDMNEEFWKFVGGHVIDGRILFPATGYLQLAMHTLAAATKKMFYELTTVFENVKFHRATALRDNSSVELIVFLNKGTQYFEITENNALVVSGRVYEAVKGKHDMQELPQPAYNEDDFILKEHDIYKELKLRGYHYKGRFRSIEQIQSSVAKVRWHGNIVAFMDCMLQALIMKTDTRNLYIPTEVEKIVIDSGAQTRDTSDIIEGTTLDVYLYPELNVVRSKNIEITGFRGTAISRRKAAAVPVLESYEFVAHQDDKRSMEEAMRINVQLIIENNPILKFKVVEVYQKVSELPLANYVDNALNDQPLIQSDISIFCKDGIDGVNDGIRIEDKTITDDKDILLVLGYNLIGSCSDLMKIKSRLSSNGFIVTLETSVISSQVDMIIITQYKIGDNYLYLLRNIAPVSNSAIFNINDKFEWLDELQKKVQQNSEIVLCSSNLPESGILGLVNCLRREQNTKDIRCMFVMDNIAINEQLYLEHLSKGLAINVYKNGQWGTYRHLLLKSDEKYSKPHTYLSVQVPGDLSSLKWVEGPVTDCTQSHPEKQLIKVCSAALNFRDIMTASGRLSADVITTVRTEQSCLQGMEFAGYGMDGQRLMGLVNSGALSSLVEADKYLLWKIPEKWTMEEAATIPIVYSTVALALLEVGRMKRGASILIHSGTGGIGQAALNVALHYGCMVFTTVGSRDKVAFLRKQYPQIDPRHIGHSRDTSFEQMVMKETKGKGVDFVLNSLSEEKLTASVRCLAAGGTYLEIGKFDLALNNALQLELAEKQASFHGVMLDKQCHVEPRLKLKYQKVMQELIDTGCVKPLPMNVFEMSAVEHAFRFMATGKHIGKVLIRVRDEFTESLNDFRCSQKSFCDCEGVYIILGGLGGFGLELADWLVLRGARKIILTSRSGVTTGYQEYRIGIWEKYGAQVNVSREVCGTEQSCSALLEEATKLGDILGIFNLAVVLQDAAFEDLSPEDFETSFLPKYRATVHLDTLSRIYCPRLRNFVVFSSVSCGRGNAGQTNYGMSNSYMERLCEKRKQEGLPALAIQWGAVGDVGLVAEMQREQVEIAIGGTLQQRISSCLEVLDVLMGQDKPVVSSMIIAQKTRASSEGGLVGRVAQIIGVRDVKTVSLYAPLPELGMDSIMGVEIKQTMERDYDILITPEDLRIMTFAKLMELTDAKEKGETVQIEKSAAVDYGLAMLLPHMTTEGDVKSSVVKLQSALTDDTCSTAIIVPGLEAVSDCMTDIAASLKKHVYAYHYVLLNNDVHSMADIASFGLQELGDKVGEKSFNIISHSIGSFVALEMAATLERRGLLGKVALIDGAPDFCQQFLQGLYKTQSNTAKEIEVITTVISRSMTMDKVAELKSLLLHCETFEERVNVAVGHMSEDSPLTTAQMKQLIISVFRKVMFAENYKFLENSKLKSAVRLYRPRTEWIKGLPEDYGLSAYTSVPVMVTRYDGNHGSILNNVDLINDIASFID